ncbi:MAG: hypothetical protein V1754_12920 [Pseudomonadota bacterium]
MKAFICSLLILCLFAPRPLAAQDNSKFWTLVTQAIGQIVRGELLAAMDSVATARQIKPAPELDALVGLIALQGGQKAEQHFESAIKAGSTTPDVFYWAGRTALTKNNSKNLFSECNKLLVLAATSQCFGWAIPSLLPLQENVKLPNNL